MELKHAVKMFFRRMGIHIEYISPKNDEWLWFCAELNKRGISALLDVGANSGQYGKLLRSKGYNGELHSFEPLKDAYKLLTDNAATSAPWQTYNIALGSANETTEIEIAGNSFSSSLLTMLDTHISSAPDSRPVGKQQITVKRLEDFFSEEFFTKNNVFLKIDTQGYELNVLKGAGNILKHIKGVQAELSFLPLYKGQPLFADVYGFLKEAGFIMVRLEKEFSDPVTGELLQANGTFFRP